MANLDYATFGSFLPASCCCWHNNNGFVKLEEQGLSPYSGFSFEVDGFVKFKKWPFIGRFDG